MCASRSASATSLDLDYAFSNELDVEGGFLTGRLRGDIIDRQRKADLLTMVVHVEGIQLDQVMAVGDVQDAAQVAVNQSDMASLLYLLGIREDEAAEP